MTTYVQRQLWSCKQERIIEQTIFAQCTITFYKKNHNIKMTISLSSKYTNITLTNIYRDRSNYNIIPSRICKFLCKT